MFLIWRFLNPLYYNYYCYYYNPITFPPGFTKLETSCSHSQTFQITAVEFGCSFSLIPQLVCLFTFIKIKEVKFQIWKYFNFILQIHKHLENSKKNLKTEFEIKFNNYSFKNFVFWFLGTWVFSFNFQPSDFIQSFINRNSQINPQYMV